MHKKQFENDGKPQQNRQLYRALHSLFHEHSRHDEPLAIAPTTDHLLPQHGQSQHRLDQRKSLPQQWFESLQRVFRPTW